MKPQAEPLRAAAASSGAQMEVPQPWEREEAFSPTGFREGLALPTPSSWASSLQTMR